MQSALKDDVVTTRRKSKSSNNPEKLNSTDNQDPTVLANVLSSNSHYSHTRPRITVEVLSDKTTSFIMNVTYLIFFLCLAYDIFREVVSFETIDYLDSPAVIAPIGSSESTDYYINVKNTDIINVLSIECSISQQNFSAIFTTLPDTYTCDQTLSFTYDFSIYAGYKYQGCGNSYAEGGAVSQSQWLKVYSLSRVQSYVDICAAQRQGTLNITLLDSTYQPQVIRHT